MSPSGAWCRDRYLIIIFQGPERDPREGLRVSEGRWSPVKPGPTDRSIPVGTHGPSRTESSRRIVSEYRTSRIQDTGWEGITVKEEWCLTEYLSWEGPSRRESSRLRKWSSKRETHPGIDVSTVSPCLRSCPTPIVLQDRGVLRSSTYWSGRRVTTLGPSRERLLSQGTPVVHQGDRRGVFRGEGDGSSVSRFQNGVVSLLSSLVGGVSGPLSLLFGLLRSFPERLYDTPRTSPTEILRLYVVLDLPPWTGP